MKTVMKFGIVLVVLAMVTSAGADMYWAGDLFLTGNDTVTVDGGVLNVGNQLKMAEMGETEIVIGYDEVEEEDIYLEVPADNVSLSVINGGSVVTGNHLTIGYGLGDVDAKITYPDSGGTATFTMEAGTSLVVGGGKDLEIGYFGNTTGILIAVGDGDAETVDIAIDDNFRVAGNDHSNSDTTGTATLTDITMTTGNTVDVGRYGATGTLTLNGTSSIDIQNGNDLTIGEGGNGEVILNGSSSIVFGDDLKIAGEENGVGVLTMNDTSSITVGDDTRLSHDDEGTVSVLNMNDDSVLNIKDTAEMGRKGSATITMTGNAAIVYTQDNEDLKFAGNGTGSVALNMSGNSSIAITDDLQAAYNDGNVNAEATIIMSDNASIIVGSAEDNGDMELGKTGKGTLTMSGTSSLNVDDDLKFAEKTDSVVVITMSGDATIDGDDMQVAKQGTGTLNVSGNVAITLSDDLELGQRGGGLGTLNMSGGTISTDDDFEMSKGEPGNAGTSVLNMIGGTINVGDDFKMAQVGGNATVNMSGGLIHIDGKLNVSHLDSSKDMTGTVAHLTVGDGTTESTIFDVSTYVAIIETGKLNMDAAYNSLDGLDGDPVDIDTWTDILLGGIILISATDTDVIGQELDEESGEMVDVYGDPYVVDESAYVQQLIDDGLILTTQAGYTVGYDFGLTEEDVTAVYLVPEPATLLLLGIGGLVLRRRKR